VEQPRPEPPPPPAPSGGKSALAFFGVVVLLFVVGILAQVAFLPAGLVWSEVFALLLPALIGTAGSNLRLGPYLKLRRPHGVAVALGALVGGAGYLLAVAVLLLTQRVVPHSWLETFDPTRVFEGPPWERVLVAAVAVLVAPPCEEIAFRGYLQTTIALRRGPATAIAGAGALFAAIHLDPVRFPSLFILGTIFGWLAWRAGSLWPAVAAHATNNAITSILFLAFADPGMDVEPASLWVILGTLAVGVGALALLVRAYRAVTSEPPPSSAALVLRDAVDPSIGFSPTRVRRALRMSVAAGIGWYVAVLLGGALFATHPRRALPAAPDVGAPPGEEPRDGNRGGAPPGRGS
jgi:membrane protease YdiL (CAAX protease family)